ncbi:MAG: hypothetical protein WBN75_20465 [Verrucomicrobiia bacterium]
MAAALNPQPPTLSRSVEHGVFNGSNCWLELAARTNGDGAFTSLSPRQPILPAPYALYAANAGSAAAGAFAGILSPTNFAAQWAGIAATGTVASATTATAAASLAGVNTASIVTNGAEYLVFTNGWYGAGVWHAETNSGFSLQHALDYAATFNPSNVVFYDTNSGFFYLSAPVGGRFQIASGKYYKPDGSRYWISNQMTATWVLTGDGYTTRIQANSNVIDTALHNQNTHAAPPCIEIGNCSIEFKIFAKAPVIYFVESEQELFFHDNLVTWSGVQESGYSDYLITQDWSLLTNQPPGEIGLVCAGSLGKQRVYGNKFCALACDVILPCEHADIERNDFFCTSTYSSNGVQRFGNLWAANDLSAAAVTENGNVFGAEVSVGAALILAGAGDTLVEANHFFSEESSYYFSPVMGGPAYGPDSFWVNLHELSGGGPTIVVADTNNPGWSGCLMSNEHGYENTAPTIVNLGWPYPYSLTNFSLQGFTYANANQNYSLATNTDDIITGEGYAIWTNSVNTNWTVKLNDPNANPDNTFFDVESNNVEVCTYPNAISINESPQSGWMDVNSVLVAGSLYLSTNSISTNRVPNVAYVNRLTSGLVESNGTIYAASYVGSGSGLTGLNPANIGAGTAAINISGNAATATTAATATNLIGNVSDSQLSANIARLNGTNTFTGVITAGNPANTFTGSFTGNGGGLTNLNASSLAGGSVPDVCLSTNIVQIGGSPAFSTPVTMSSFLTLARTTIVPADGSTIIPASSYVLLNPATAVALNGVTAISSGSRVGDVLILQGNSDVNLVTISNNANTKLTAASHVLGANDMLVLMWNGVAWAEVSFANN